MPGTASLLQRRPSSEMTDQELRLMMGELNVEELRLVRATLNWANGVADAIIAERDARIAELEAQLLGAGPKGSEVW